MNQTLHLSAKNDDFVETKKIVKIDKVDEDQHLVFGVAYAPFELDTYSDSMIREEVVKTAYKFMADGNINKIDIMHDYQSTSSYVVESFIARKGDPDFPEGAWVLGVKIPDEDIWADIKSGKLSGFSIAGVSKMVPAVAEVYINVVSFGQTEKNDDHQHLFFLELDDDGRVKGGRTSVEKNHAHEIKAGTATEMAYGHSHRYQV